MAFSKQFPMLSRYVGWGGLPQAFDPDNKEWAKEYAELSELLTPEEFDSARASTLNAHYTPPTVIKAMWETIERLGFTSGNVLEPSMGVGNFFGLVPENLRRSKLYGVELDSVTARIAQKLYPNANIQQKGFEKTEFSDSFFDVAVGNVPFGSYGVHDSKFDKLNLSIHNYFFAKTLDKVRPGGVMAFVTSKFTMDEKTPKFRKYLAERAELLGAVRLPNTAFLKNAGTETTMDILFLQKRDRPLDIEPEWVHLGLTEDGIPVNRYFLDNPEMILGKMALDERMNNKYGRNDYTCCLPTEGADLGEQLKAALSLVEGEITLEELDDVEGIDNHAIPADYDIKNFSYTVVGGNVYFRENSLMYPVDLPATTLDRIKGMIGLRDCVKTLIDFQLDEFPDSAVKAQQAKLNTLYDKFNADFGLINSTANNRAFNADSSYYLLSSLEMLNEDGELDRKADMFTKRTIKQKTVVSHVDTASEALAVSLGERACVDLAYMSDLTGKDEQTLFDDLHGVIFLDLPETPGGAARYVTADEFLSGNVREKLAVYSRMAQIVPDDHEHRNAILDNAEALKAVQPKDLEPSEIAVRIRALHAVPDDSGYRRCDENLVPIIGHKDLDAEAEAFLREFYPQALDKPQALPIKEILEDGLDLVVLPGGRPVIGNGDTNGDGEQPFGQIFFTETPIEFTCPMSGETKRGMASRGTVLVELTRAAGSEGCVNNTLAHEGLHWHRHRMYAVIHNILHHDKPFIACRKSARTPKRGKSWTDESRLEWQANSIAPRILMPKEPFKVKAMEFMARRGYLAGEYYSAAALDAVIRDLAAFFAVSKQSVSIRLVEVGLISRAEQLGAAAMSCFRTTTSISLNDAFREYRENTDFRELVDSGAFRYVERHFVLNDNRYIAELYGRAALTNYARSHQSECCLTFTLRNVYPENGGMPKNVAYLRNGDKLRTEPRFESDNSVINAEEMRRLREKYKSEYGSFAVVTPTFSHFAVELMTKKHWNRAIFKELTLLDDSAYTRITRQLRKSAPQNRLQGAVRLK
ncbi:hypothetical protein FACS18949_15130 [Clostridia bacterium]|nr:hypothetical protein FACS18949_15130 [Clostridia bacterium]